jgi:drug/metabolite transporter (DMT)-like permease
VSLRQLTIVAVLLSSLGAFNGFSWYLSLPKTLAAANNAIYQSASAFVFVFSTFLLGERATPQKGLAVLFSVVGVVVVSLAPTGVSTDPNIEPSVVGYLWVLASTVGYGLFEVLYSRYTEQPITRAADIWSRSFVSSHAVAEAKDLASSAHLHADAAAGSSAASARRSSVTSLELPLEPAHADVRHRLNSSEASPRSAAVNPAFVSTDEPNFGEEARTPAAADALPLLSEAAKGSGIHPNRGSSAVAPLTPGPAHAIDGAPDVAIPIVYKAELSAYMLGMMGLGIAATLWPLFFILDRTGVEPFVMPDGPHMQKLAVSAVLDSLFNIAMLFGILVTSPLWTAVGTILVIPGTMVVDWLLHGAMVGAQQAGGILLILIGFGILQAPVRLNAWLNRMVGPVSTFVSRPRQRGEAGQSGDAPSP